MTEPLLTVMLPTYAAEDPGSWDRVFEIARAADLAGIDRLVVSDHVVFGENLDAYANPETGGVEGGRQPTGPDGHWLEPLTVLTAVAVQTDRIRLGTYILLAALRRPVVLAKQVATLDVLSRGRVDLGVGIGWQREEYEAAGLDFAARGRLLDQSLEVCRTLWRDERAAFTSPDLSFDGIHAMPKPRQPGGVPIWVSGRCNARVAQRLARFGSGWIPWAGDAADPTASIPRMRAAVDALGADASALSVLAPLPLRRAADKSVDLAGSMEQVPALVDAGVTDLLAHVRVPDSEAGALETFSELATAFKAVTARVSPVRSAPAPGAAPMPAADAAALLRRNASDPDLRDRPALRFGDQVWTHGEYVAECHRFANLFIARRPAGRARAVHVGVLLDNTPEYLFALGGAALCGTAVVGINHTRREEHLLRDLRHTDCDVVLSEPRHLPLLAPIANDLPELLVSNRYPDELDPSAAFGADLDDALGAVDGTDAGIEPGPDTLWGLIFTSGTSDAPKAVICTQRRLLVTGNRMGMIMDLSADDTGYVCMPLFHSSALMVGWAPSLVYGASVGLARRFSASGWLNDVRHYGASYTNYTGKPLAYILSTPEQPDDAENSLRVAFGNEGSPDVVDRFARRFELEVIDAYGATEGGIAVNRDVEGRTGALGQVGDTIKVVDAEGNELAVARFDAEGRLENADESVGEIVNTAGAGPFEGYYNNDDANRKTLRFGWYWSGDLGYIDADRYLYFAGRNADWLRVDGENFPAQPIEATIGGHPDVVIAVVYGVADDQAGDQVMAGLVLRDGATFDPAAFGRWLDAQDAIGPKWRPRYVRVLRDPPTTGTNKVVKRTLVHQKWRRDRVGGDAVYLRGRGDAEYRAFGDADEQALRDSFAQNGRERFLDL